MAPRWRDCSVCKSTFGTTYSGDTPICPACYKDLRGFCKDVGIPWYPKKQAFHKKSSVDINIYKED